MTQYGLQGSGWGYIAGEVVRTMVDMHGTKERILPKNSCLTILLVLIGTLVNYTGCMTLHSALQDTNNFTQ